MPDVVGPTGKEMAEHDLTHIPYRDWCKHCVQGRARENQHRRQQGDQKDEIPLIAMDYCSMGKNEERVATTIVIKDKESKAMKAYEVTRERFRRWRSCEQDQSVD